MIRWFLRQVADFDANSTYDWFLAFFMIYLLIIMAGMLFVPEAPPAKPAFTPYG